MVHILDLVYTFSDVYDFGIFHSNLNQTKYVTLNIMENRQFEIDPQKNMFYYAQWINVS
jgi:hypothetical protein